jgi:hypothetical protein
MATDPDHHSKDETAPTLGELQRVYDRVSPGFVGEFWPQM